MKKQLALKMFLSQVGPGGCDYHEENKAKFHRLAMAAMRELEGQLGFSGESSVHWNAGGIAVSGDVMLMGMWATGNGVYISLNNGALAYCGDFMFRSIKHMKDYTGGSNCWAKFAELGTEEFVNRLKRLRE